MSEHDADRQHDESGAAPMPIGMFSRATLISIPTLRTYHESGLLVPAVVDPRTGYRNYTPDQLADAAIIVRLRALDLPLSQVREVLDRRDPEVTRKVLAGHRAAMEDRLAETERIVAELSTGSSAITHTPVHVRHEPAVHTLRVVGEVTVDDAKTFIGFGFERIFAAVATTGAVPIGPPGALYEQVLADEPTRIELYVPIGEPVAVVVDERGVGLGELRATEAAVLVHAGPYEACAATYRTLGAWVARNATHADERVREVYLVGPGQTDDPNEYRTEVVWPIRRSPAAPRAATSTADRHGRPDDRSTT